MRKKNNGRVKISTKSPHIPHSCLPSASIWTCSEEQLLKLRPLKRKWYWALLRILELRIMRTWKLSVCSGQVLSQPFTAFAHAVPSKYTCIPFKDWVPWDQKGGLWATIPILLLPCRCQSLVCGTFLCCWWLKALGEAPGELSRRGAGARGGLAADPGWRVRLQKGEMVKPWIYQKSGICAMSIAIKNSNAVMHILLLCAAQGESQGCWQWPYPGADPRLCFPLPCSTAEFDSITFQPTTSCNTRGLFTHLCAKIPIRKPLNLIDHFLLCEVERAVRNTQW